MFSLFNEEGKNDIAYLYFTLHDFITRPHDCAIKVAHLTTGVVTEKL